MNTVQPWWRWGMRRVGLLFVLLMLSLNGCLIDQAHGQGISCDDFNTQAAAQAVLDADASDPNNLDADGNGIACDDLANETPSATAESDSVNLEGIPSTAKPAQILDHRDGGTLVVQVDDQRKAVVLIGLEVPNADARPYGECFAQEAFERLQKVVKKGATVYLESDTVDRDEDRRLLRYVWLPGKGSTKPALINVKMVRDGFAGYDAEETKNIAYSDRLADAEARAKDEGRGIWKSCGGPHVAIQPTPTPPPGIGSTIRVGTWDLTVNGTELRDSINDFDPQAARGVFLVVLFSISNTTNSPQVFSYDGLSLRDENGTSFSYDSEATITVTIFDFDTGIFDELQPGLTYQTAVVFDVPTEAQGFELLTTGGQSIRLDR